MSTSGANNVGKDLADQVKHGAAGIHGLGEAIRGNMNQVVDGVFNDKAGSARNEQTIQKGLNEIEDGKLRGKLESERKTTA